MAEPFYYLGPLTSPPKPFPITALPPESTPLPSVQPPAHSDIPAPKIKRQRSLCACTMPNITWNEPSTRHAPTGPKPPRTDGKLHKPPRQVHFTPLPSTPPTTSAGAVPPPPPPAVADHAHAPAPNVVPLPVPEPVPVPIPIPLPVSDASTSEDPVKLRQEQQAVPLVRREGTLKRMFSPRKKGSNQPSTHPTGAAPPPLDLPAPSSPDGPATDTQSEVEEWHHHASYFPEYEPISTAPVAPAEDEVKPHSSYFPEYTPLLHRSHPLNGYPGASAAVAYALTTPETAAAAHAQKIGHDVGVYYPDLPKFADYDSKKGGNGWKSGQYAFGVDGWTGFGWAGEKLPDAEGRIFGAPMPSGAPMAKSNGGNGGGKGKKKGG